MLSEISNELVLQVYSDLHSISDVINLSLTCRRFHDLLPTARRITMLFAAAEREFGPLHDAIQVVVLQAESPHVDRSAPLSLSLLRQLISLGRVGQRFESLYPRLKWKHNFVERRSLTNDERYRLRRALYRIWRYSAAFHTFTYPRTTRMLRSSFEKRAMILRLPTQELLELEDVRRTLQENLNSSIVPKTSEAQARPRDRWHNSEGSHNVHPSFLNAFFHSFEPATYSDECNDSFDDEGFLDEISQYYLVQDLMKLDPGQLLWLMDQRKWQISAFIREQGEWFGNNGETLGITLHMILLARGHHDLLSEGDFGVVGTEVLPS